MPSAIARVDVAAPVGPQLYELLRSAIIRAELVPATRVSESEVAARHGISRQPVREAFIKLAEEGLVEIRPQRGTFITRISLEAVMNARFVREAVEADIVRLLAETRTDALLFKLDAALAEQRAALADAPERFIELDEAFHRMLAAACGKETVWTIIESLKAQMDRVRYLNLVQHFPTAELLAQHEAIAEAVASRDPAGAEAAMRGHLQQILDDLPAIAAGRPEYFDPTP